MKKRNFIVFLLLVSAASLCLWIGFREVLAQRSARDSFRMLEASLSTAEKKDSPKPEESNDETPSAPETEERPRRDLSMLFAQKEDCIGWLNIPGTDISYPVMHTPNNPQQYLYLDFHGEYSSSGTPFLDERCSSDGDHLIIYGHNMTFGTLFAPLGGYLQEDFCRTHPTVVLETASGRADYTVFAVAKIQADDAWYGCLAGNGLSSAVSDLCSRALYTTGALPEPGQQILTLSTCYDSAHGGRLVVAGVKTN